MFRAAVRWLIGGVLACRSTKYASQQRVFFIFRGPTGRTCTYRRWRHVRDLIIAKIGRTTRPILLCRSGSDKRIASDSLYDDQRRFGFRVVRGGRFPAYSSRAGSLETCGFKQTFWSLLGLRPKVTRARGRGTFPAGGMQGKSRQVAAAKSDLRSEARNIPFGKRIAGRRGRRPLQCAGTEPRRNERGRGRTSVRQTFPAII